MVMNTRLVYLFDTRRQIHINLIQIQIAQVISIITIEIGFKDGGKDSDEPFPTVYIECTRR